MRRREASVKVRCALRPAQASSERSRPLERSFVENVVSGTPRYIIQVHRPRTAPPAQVETLSSSLFPPLSLNYARYKLSHNSLSSFLPSISSSSHSLPKVTLVSNCFISPSLGMSGIACVCFWRRRASGLKKPVSLRLSFAPGAEEEQGEEVGGRRVERETSSGV
jgi:hypothetical protein